jgi:hypothetical protein
MCPQYNNKKSWVRRAWKKKTNKLEKSIQTYLALLFANIFKSTIYFVSDIFEH